MGQSVNLIRYGGNAVLNTLQIALTESSSLNRYVVADGSGKVYYSTASAGGGGGTVTNVSVATANGLAGSVANPTTTPAITLSTTVTGLLKGNGTSISAASAGTDYISSTVGTASWATNALTASLPLRGLITASVSNTTITFTKGDGSTFDITVAQSGSVATASYALFAVSSSFATSASYALSASIATTASYVLQAVSASFATQAANATTASYVLQAVSASFATQAANATTASYILNAVSASFASTASFVTTAQTASYVLQAVSASFATTAANATTASYVLQAVSASFATLAQTANTASYVLNAVSASFATLAQTANTASYVLNAVSASFATTAANATTASYVLNAISASFATTAANATTASYVLQAVSASFATTAANATTASYVLNAISASFATTAANATTASYVLQAVSASFATQAASATTASYVLNAVSASFATTAANATTASYVLNAVSASFATTASYVLNAVSASFASTASSADNFTVRGTLTAQTIIAQTITSSTDFVTGSTRFGSLLTDTHQFTGSVSITGSLAVNGSNVILSNQTSSMSVATASYVLNAVSASFATTAVNATTASYVLNAVSASFATTAANATTASYVLNAVSASFASTSSNVLGGATNYIPLWNTNTTLSSSVMYQSSSNVGIGTTSPDYKLDINSASSYKTLMLRANAIGTRFDAALDFNAVNVSTSPYARIGLQVTTATAGSETGGLTFWTINNGSLSEKLLISSGGNVGIGTTSPTSNLHISSSNAAIARFGANSSNKTLIVGAETGGNYVTADIAQVLVTNGNLHIDSTSGQILYLQYYATTNTIINAQGGNVGIGTTAPAYKLEVNGTSYFTSTMGINGEGNGITVDTGYGNNGRVGLMKYGGLEGMLVAGNTTTLRLGHRTDSDYVASGSAATIRVDMLIATNGSVGIGTTSPGAKLHISSSTVNDALLITTPNNNSTLYPFFLGGATLTSDNYLRANNNIIEFFRNGGPATIRTVGSTNNLVLQSATNLIFNTNGSERMRITDTGNVGIGTTSPSRSLHLVGASALFQNAGAFELDLLNSTSGNYLRATAGATDSNIGTIQNIPFSFIMNSSRVGQFTSTNGNLILQNGGTFSDTGERLKVSGSVSITGNTLISAGNLSIFTTNTPRRINLQVANGSKAAAIGIEAGGTMHSVIGPDTSVTDFLQIASRAGISFYSNSTIGNIVTDPTNERMRLDTNGNLGIGTTSASAYSMQLAVVNNIGLIPTTQNTVGSAVYLKSQLGASGGENFISNEITTFNNAANYDTSLIFLTRLGTSASERMRLTSTGLGIGTTSPSAKLDVSGSVNIAEDINLSRAISPAIVSTTNQNIRLSTNGFEAVLDTTGRFRTSIGFRTDGFLQAVNLAVGASFYNTTAPTNGAIIQGNVGIGTTSPSSTLTVSGSISGSGAVYFKGITSATQTNIVSIDTTTGQLYYQATGSFVAASASYAATASNVLGGTTNYLARWTSATTLGIGVAYDNGTNVGIGTTSPSSKLDVVGSGTISGIASLGISETTTLAYIGDRNTVGTRYIRFSRSSSLTDIVNIQGVNGGIGAANIALQAEGGNVGIGTTSPATKFVVSNAGASGLEIDPIGGVGSGVLFQAYNRSTSAYMAQSYYALSHTFNVGSGGSTRVLDITSGGNVGIGTTSPTDKLDVAGGIISTGTYQARMIGGAGGAYFGSMTSIPVIFQVNQNEVARFDSSGNLGIGTTSPGAKLHISSSTVNDALLITTPNNNTSLYPFFLGGPTLTSDNYLRANASIIEFFRNGAPATIRTVGSTNNLTLQSANNLIFNTNGANEYARIDTNGNVGIGTTSPASLLHVSKAGNSAGGTILMGIANDSTSKWSYLVSTQYNSSTHPQGYALIGGFTSATANTVIIGGNIYEANPATEIQFWTHTAVSHNLGGSQRMTINTSGNVGIGTTSPTVSLQVQSSSFPEQRITDGTIGYQMYSSTGGSEFVCGTFTNHSLVFRTNATEQLRLTSTGLGIGTTSPGEKLTINGYIGLQYSGTQKWHLGADSSNNLSFVRSGIAERMVLNSDGNLGLGVTPSAWDTVSAMQFTGGSVASYSNYAMWLSSNAFYTAASGWKYVASTTAAQYLLDGNIHKWYIAPSGTAGNAITFTQAMTLTSGGDLAVGTTGTTYARVQINKSGAGFQDALILENTNSAAANLGTSLTFAGAGSVAQTVIRSGWDGAATTDAYLSFLTKGSGSVTERLRITSGGDVGIGTSSPGATLDVNGTIYSRSASGIYSDAFSAYSGSSISMNAGSSHFAVTVNSSERLRITSGGNLLVGTTADQGYRVQITGSGDNMLNVWGATAPSIRLDNAASGATQRFLIGLATATNNFIQGASAGNVCITTASASPIVFGMWQTSTASEVMRITTSNNLLINKTVDGGQRLQVSGSVNLASLPTSASGLVAGDVWNNSGVLNIV